MSPAASDLRHLTQFANERVHNLDAFHVFAFSAVCTREASWNEMLIDWERAGPERRFELRVSNVLQAGKFYRDVFGAEETFRQKTHNGKVFRLGFAIGRIGFAISSEGDVEQERPLLSSIAEELGSPFVAVILRVEDPDRMARAAQEAGSELTRAHELDVITVVTDPFGGHWALVKCEPVPVANLSGVAVDREADDGR